VNTKLARLSPGFLILGFFILFSTSLRAADAPPVVPLESYGESQKIIRAKINGQEGTFLFDSGGGVTNVTPEFAEEIGRKPWGKIVGFRMTGQRVDMARCDDVMLEIAGVQEHLPIIGVFDLMSLLPPGASKLDGMIGLDAFANKSISIDLANQRIVIETPESFAARINGATEEAVRVVRDGEGLALTLDAAVKTAHGTAWMELDTGNDGDIVVADWLADEFGLDPTKKDAQPIKFQLANGLKGEGRGRARDLIMDGNLGSQVLRNWIVTFDLPHGRAWFSPTQSER
jgi:Aspartyl protease